MTDNKKDPVVQLGLADLRLLMDNYQNIIKMSAVQLEQQKQVIDLQQQILSKQDATATKQFQACNSLDKIINELNDCRKNLEKTNDSINSTSSHTQEQLQDLKLSTSKEHGGINNRLYVSMGGMITIVISLIGIMSITYNKFELVQEVYNMIKSMITHFGI
jgi:hypothetical protein